jgi:hypothetical protein
MKTNDNNVKNFLKRAKLLMEYDLKKTSDENIKILNEQDDDDRVVQDPAMDSTKCSRWNESQAEKYYRDVSEALNIELGVPDIMFQGLKKQKTETGGSWGETNTATLDKEVELLEDYLDLSLNPFGDSFEAGKILSLFNRFADYAVLGTDENGASKWFPACEYIRMQYIVQTDGETLHTELEDPSGWTDSEEERTAKAVEDKIIYCYKNWMRALQKFNGCPPYNIKPKPPVDPKPPIVDPKTNIDLECIDTNNFAKVGKVSADGKTVKVRPKKGAALITIMKDTETDSFGYGTFVVTDGTTGVEISSGTYRCDSGQWKMVRNVPKS